MFHGYAWIHIENAFTFLQGIKVTVTLRIRAFKLSFLKPLYNPTLYKEWFSLALFFIFLVVIVMGTN